MRLGAQRARGGTITPQSCALGDVDGTHREQRPVTLCTKMRWSQVFVRHGETELNALKILQSHATPLNESGHEQARHAGLHLAQSLPNGARVVKILHSDMVRTHQTAMHIADAFKRLGHDAIELVASPLLRERNFGDLSGQTYAAAMEIMGEHIFAGVEKASPPNGEPISAFLARAAQAWAWVQAQAAGVDECIVVTHGMLLNVLVTSTFDIPKGALAKGFGNTAITIVAREAPHVVQVLNSIAHLPPVALAAKL